MPKTPLDAHYYHKVVDCQYACPAHTNVPEYIRLIAQGRYADAYMLNRSSNVFPGILGRVCDRPCEPACRRSRVEKDPVAICRLKRVASDFKGDIKARLPRAPENKKDKSVALIGSGPAALTVANDLLPLGYRVVIFEKADRLGGAMRYAVPGFRLPEEVLDEEIANIVNMGAEVHTNRPVTQLRGLLDQRFDAIFVGSGAPVGRDLNLAGRNEAASNIFIGLDWLANVAFGHVVSTPKRTIVIGGGNTAMDCCRTAKRLGATEVEVFAPEAFGEMLASPWEKDESLEEGIKINNHLLPQEFIVENGKLKAMRFQKLKRLFDDKKRWAPEPSGEADVIVPCDAVILAVGQNNAYPFIGDDCGIEFSPSGKPVLNEKTFQSTNKKVFFGGDAAFGPKNIIWAVAHGHEAALSIDQFLSGKNVEDRPTIGMHLSSQKMGVHDWSYSNSYANEKRIKVPHLDMQERFRDPKNEVELGFDEALALKEAERCLNCDVQTVFSESLCIECDACVDICPLNCLTITPDGPLAEISERLSAPRLHPQTQSTLVSGPLKDTARVMVKDEDVCIHCGLCAERCPTGAWDMQKFTLDLKHAGGAT